MSGQDEVTRRCGTCVWFSLDTKNKWEEGPCTALPPQIVSNDTYNDHSFYFDIPTVRSSRKACSLYAAVEGTHAT